MKRFPQKMLAVVMAVSALYLCVYSVFFWRQDVLTSGTEDDAACVIIDAGHGGEDGGATGISGVSEAMLNLEISLRLRDLLSLCGIRTSMIREKDVAVYTEGCRTISEKKVSDLKNRVKTVNETPNAVLVSIHQNFFEQSKYDGAQVFYADTEHSSQWAEQTQQLLRDCLDKGNRRECKPSRSVYLMEHIHCPAILVECGFISNPAEEKHLQESDYQKKIACAICVSVSRFLAEEGESDEV